MQSKLLWMVLFAGSIALTFLPADPVFAQDGTPTSAVVQSSTSLPWYVGVIIFIGIAVGATIFKSRLAVARKKTFVGGNCCVPLVKDGEQPFQPIDDADQPKP